MVPLSWPKTILMILEYESETYNKCADIMGSDDLAHMILNTMNQYHDSEPWLYQHLTYLECLRCISVSLQWPKAIVMLLEHPSGTYTTCVATQGNIGYADMIINTMHQHSDFDFAPPGYAKTWYIWGGLRYGVPLPWLKAITVVLEHQSGTYTKCITTQGCNG